MKISVLTPSFNAAKYIERAIESVLNQNYKNWEHIIMDGGSTDGTVEILKSHPHLIWKSERDKGQSDAMNKAFNLSTGDIIVYLNADDYFDENVFTSVVDEFKKNSSTDMVVGNGTIIYPNGRMWAWDSETEYLKVLQHYKYYFPFNPVSYFYKRHVQEKIPFSNTNTYSMDYEFLLRAFQIFKTAKVEQNFGFFCCDGENKSSVMVDPNREQQKTALKHCLTFDKRSYPVYWFYYYKFKIQQKLKSLNKLKLLLTSK